MYYLHDRMTGQPAQITNKVYTSRLVARAARDQIHERNHLKSQRVDVVEISRSARLRMENEARRGN